MSLIPLIVSTWAAAVATWSPLGIDNALTPADTYETSANHKYGRDLRQKLEVYQPRPLADTRTLHDGYPVGIAYGSTMDVSNRDGALTVIGDLLHHD